MQYVPEALKTEALCLAAVQNGRYDTALRFVPEAQKTEAVCLAAVQEDIRMLQYVPEAMKTEAICLAAMKQDVRAFEYVPETLKTEAVCLAAVKQNIWAFKYVPEKLKATDLFNAVFLETMHNTYVEGRAPAYAQFAQDRYDLNQVPEELRTEAVCLAAVQEDIRILRLVPDALKTEAFESKIRSVISSGSGGSGYGVQLI